MLHVSRRSLGALAVGLALVVTACGGANSGNSLEVTGPAPDAAATAGDVKTPVAAATTPLASGREHTVTKDDNGTTITVAAGDVINVELEACTSCGYGWREDTAPDAAVLTLSGSKMVQPDNPDGLVGGSETAVFTYQAVGVGSAKVDLGYYPPADDTAEESYALTVVVAGLPVST